MYWYIYKYRYTHLYIRTYTYAYTQICVYTFTDTFDEYRAHTSDKYICKKRHIFWQVDMSLFTSWYVSSCIYSRSHLGWHFRMLFQSSKLKARWSLFNETWQKRRSNFELWAFENVTPSGIGCICKKRHINFSKETNTHIISDVLLCQKRRIIMSKETYYLVKRDEFIFVEYIYTWIEYICICLIEVSCQKKRIHMLKEYSRIHVLH